MKKREAARQTLAEWDVAEEREEEEMDAESTERLSVALRKGRRNYEPDTSGSEGESFDFNAMEIDDSNAESKLEEEPVKKCKVRSHSTNKVSH